MNFSRIQRRGSRWEVVSGSDEKGCAIWAKLRSRRAAEEYARKLAQACDGEYRGERPA